MARHDQRMVEVLCYMCRNNAHEQCVNKKVGHRGICDCRKGACSDVPSQED